MVDSDLEYICRLITAKVIKEPVLELGAGYGGNTCQPVVEAAGLRYVGTDLVRGAAVEFAANFEKQQDMVVFAPIGPIGTILILNVLEHTFDPIRVLDNAVSLLRPSGSLVIITPAVWPLHNYPLDVWRILPNFYEEFARRRGLKLLEGFFEYIGVGSVHQFRGPDNAYSLPPPAKPGLAYLSDRVIHKLFNTFGRSMFQPSHVSVGAVLTTPNGSSAALGAS